MIEVLQKLGDGECVNCGEPITRFAGDLGTDSWFHDSSGRQECPGSTHAEPKR